MAAVVLPLKVDGWPAIRILTKPTWSGKAAWTDQPMVQMAPKPVTRGGFEFLKCRRTTVDQDGYAVFRFVYGEMDKRVYPAAIDLHRNEVRILAQDPDKAWYTIWWGTVEQQLDLGMSPADSLPHGSREYHCLDGVAGRMRHWPLDHHGVYISGGTQRPPAGVVVSPCRGHPGFNAMRWDGRIAGTKESSGVLYNPNNDLTGPLKDRAFYHTYPGNGKEWTDKEAVETAIAEARPVGEVPFYIDGAVELLSGRSVWPVPDDSTCLDFLRRVLRRQRGRGLAYVDWDESGDPIAGTFTPKISIRPQNLGDITYTPTGVSDPNTGSAYVPITLRGATTYGSAIAIDLTGDHRLGPNAESTFELGDRAAYAVQYLETQGEQIEVVITGAFDDTPTPVLEKRWADIEATNFLNATTDARMRMRFQSVYQLFGLARDWGGTAGNGLSTGKMTRADFRCMDDGSILVPAGGVGDTSSLVVEVMRDLPLYAEYNYVQNYPSPRYDALTQDPIPPARRAPLILCRMSPTAPGRFLQIAPTPTAGVLQAMVQATFQITDFGIALFVVGDTATGVRTISDPTIDSLGATIDYRSIVMTLGLRLPHRVRFASAAANPAGGTYTADTAPRRKLITHPNHHLWLAHVSAIWELDPTAYDSASGGYSPLRSAANGSDTVPGIIRDDRAGLEQLHRLAWQWYGTDHQTASWQMHCCGLLPQFSSGVDGKSRTAYPAIGQTVSTMTAAGSANALGTPISVVDYDHVKCITRWATDWSDLDTR